MKTVGVFIPYSRRILETNKKRLSNKKLSPTEEEELYIEFLQTGKTIAFFAKKYGVTETLVSGLITRNLAMRRNC